MAASRNEIEYHQKELGRLSKQLGEIDGRIEEFLDALGDKRLPRDMIADKIEEEEKRKQQVETAIANQEEKLPVLPPPLGTFRAELSEGMAEPETKKAAIRALIERITVHPDTTLEIEYSIKSKLNSGKPAHSDQRRSAIQDSANCADKIFKGTVSSRLYPYFFDEGFEDITASFSILETFSQ